MGGFWCYAPSKVFFLTSEILVSMSKFLFSPQAIAALKANVSVLQQPSASQGGTILVDQDLCLKFHQAGEQGLEVTLLSFTCNNLPENRTRSIGEGENKFTVVRADSMQQRGTAEIQVGADKYTVPMHAPVALSFVEKETQILVGSVGDITIGRNKDKKWLSLRLPAEPTQNDLIKWAEVAEKSAVNPAAVKPKKAP